VTTSDPTTPARSQDERFQRVAEAALDDVLALHPVVATELGDHRFDDRLPDARPEALERERRTLEARQTPHVAIVFTTLLAMALIGCLAFQHTLSQGILPEEGKERLAYLAEHRPSVHAFWFGAGYPTHPTARELADDGR